MVQNRDLPVLNYERILYYTIATRRPKGMQRALGTVSHLLKSKAFVNGEWIDGAHSFDVINPATLETVGSAPKLSREDVRAAVASAGEAQGAWGRRSGYERGRVLRRWMETVLEHRNALGTLMTLESGKALQEAKGEVDYGASFLEWFSEEARRAYGELVPSPSADKLLMVHREPVGPCALITPWNFPAALILRKAGAALAAGCCVVVKPSEETPLSALALAELGQRAGIPPGVFNVVTSDREGTPALGEELCTNPTIRALSFTGSCAVGKQLYSMATSSVKRISLELGGNAPFIVFPSADMEAVMRALDIAKFRNNGQACVAANRVLVHSSRLEEFLGRSLSLLEGKRVGNGLEEGVQLGPLINQAALNKVRRHVSDARRKGGKVLTGESGTGDRGHFYKPTLLTGLSRDMVAWREETFGPVLSVRSFSSEEEAVSLGNDVSEGLVAYVMSSDYRQISRVTSQLCYGMVGVNEGLLSLASIPFGGVKESGIGREGGRQGMEEFLEYKYVCLGGLS